MSFEAGRQGFVSTENAVLMGAAHVGTDRAECLNAVWMCFRWPRLARALSWQFDMYEPIPQISCCDPNLKGDVECRRDFHVPQDSADTYQNFNEISIIRSEVEAANMKSSLAKKDFVIFVVRANRDPRSFSNIPSFVAFRAPGRQLYGFFPHDDENLRAEIFLFLVQKTLLLRRPESVRKWLSPNKAKFSHVDVGSLTMKYGFGRSDDAITDFTWGKRFCIIARDEWFCDPLSRSQEFHVAYVLNLFDALVEKIGLSAVLGNKSGPRFVARV